MFVPLGLPLYFLIFHPIISCSCSDASTTCGGSSINITWPFSTDPQCKGAHLIHCNGSTPTIQIDGLGHSYIVEHITGDILTVQDQHLSKLMQGSNCNFLYDFMEPYPSFDSAHFVQYLSSDRTLFNCTPREYDFSQDIFDGLNNFTPCEGYNLHYSYGVENQLIDSVLLEVCKPSSPPYFEWKLSFEEGGNGLSLHSAGFSKQLVLYKDCFRCHIVSGRCTSDTVMGGDGCSCSNVCFAAQNETTKHKKNTVKIAIGVGVGVGLLAVFFVCCIWYNRGKIMRQSSSSSKFLIGTGSSTIQVDQEMGSNSYRTHVFSYAELHEATNGFDESRELGVGGFGTVYKGKFVDGQEIAVKRLAAKSGQGRQEFENEIILIAKLQHRNLVRLLGYCMHGEEKILIYEYMPNKSLDYFLYDTTRRAQLYWSRRLHIIEGISQGLLYLHKHSRLRIIHRDLKASNILLDADMNPKISDFGLARIFGTNETEANTNRIVGTYGYMSPEYAAEGLFSIKSDVYSFGVLLLEIVSGSKNTSYHRDGNTLNLSGYAWELWKEAKLLELVDPSFEENCPKHEISRCIHIALMCVQENAIDRPNMSDVIAMLSSDSAIADPKQPAFFNVRNPAEEEFRYVNEATMTSINGR